MKYCLLGLISCLWINLLSAQHKKKISIFELDKINGLYFQPNTIKPYSGTAIETFTNGDKKRHVPIKEGKIHGTIKEWAQNGRKIVESQYEMGVQIGQERHWYDNGKLQLEVSFAEGKPNGICTEWYRNGQKKSSGEFVSGLEEGKHQWWHFNGQLDQIIPFKGGKANGEVIEYYSDGKMRSQSQFVEGQRNGLSVEWYSNEKKHLEGPYQAGKKHGEFKSWSRKGLLVGIQTFDQDQLVKDLNYRSGSIRYSDGYVQVFNNTNTFYTLTISGEEEILPQPGGIISYTVDSLMLQIFEEAVPEVEGSAADSVALQAFVQKAQEALELKADTSVQFQANWMRSEQGLPIVHWSCSYPDPAVVDSTSLYVKEEQFISIHCEEEILCLYSAITDAAQSETVARLLKRIAKTIRMEKERIELNALRDSLLN